MADTKPINIPALSAKDRAEKRQIQAKIRSLMKARDNLKEAEVDTTELDKALGQLKEAADLLDRAEENLIK